MKFLLLIPFIVLAGCQTEATSKRFQQAQSDVLTCQQAALKAMQGKPQVMFKDERNALVYLVVQELAKSKSGNMMESCDDAFIAMTQADMQKTAGINGIVKTGVGWGLGLVGMKILVDGVVDISDPADGAVSRTQNNYNSRVVSDSTATGGSSVSASGEGLGILNNTGGTDAVGGYIPRAQMDMQGNGTSSTSGEFSVLPPIESPEVTIPE